MGIHGKDESFVIKPQFDNATGFDGGVAMVQIHGSERFINKSGGFIDKK